MAVADRIHGDRMRKYVLYTQCPPLASDSVFKILVHEMICAVAQCLCICGHRFEKFRHLRAHVSRGALVRMVIDCVLRWHAA